MNDIPFTPVTPVVLVVRSGYSQHPRGEISGKRVVGRTRLLEVFGGNYTGCHWVDAARWYTANGESHCKDEQREGHLDQHNTMVTWRPSIISHVSESIQILAGESFRAGGGGGGGQAVNSRNVEASGLDYKPGRGL